MNQPLLTGHFLKWEKTKPGAVFLRQPVNGVWHSWTYAQAGDECRRMAQALRNLGVAPGSHVAILSKNCAHWLMADIAIMMAGCISIPIYPSLTSTAIHPILQHADTKAIIVGKLDKYEEQRAAVDAGVIAISIEAYGLQETYTWEKLVQQNEPLQELHQWQPKDIFTIVYTSGTTGNPKGVMHRVESVEAVTAVGIRDLQLPHEPDLFSFLPLSHIAERLAIEFLGMCNGANIAFAEGLDSFAKNLEEIQPHLFFAVPRLWSKFREGILHKMPQQRLNLLLSIPFVRSLVKRGIRKKLGLSRASHIYSAAAPISMELLQWFDKLGITIFQGYGMTEDMAYSHFCCPGGNKFGTVGKALSGLQVKFAEDGEIRVKSMGNMEGYYKEPAMTAEAFDKEGYLKTGDIGEYDHEGYLTITGRVKDQFKTDKGKYISPAPIETRLHINPVIDQVCVVGTGIPQPIMLIVLSEIGLKLSRPELSKSLEATLAQVNKELEKFERIEKAVIMKEHWTIDNGLLTPSLKVKRNLVEKIHLPYYPNWFATPGTVVWE